MRIGFARASATSAARSLPVTRKTVEHSHDRSPVRPHAGLRAHLGVHGRRAGSSARRHVRRSYRRPTGRSGPGQAGAGSASAWRPRPAGSRPCSSRPAASTRRRGSRPPPSCASGATTMTSCASLRNSCDEVEEAVQVDVVERGLDLVQQVEGRRPGAEHREQERQRGERALATGEQRQPAHVLARRARLHLDAGVEQVVGVGEEHPTRAAGEQRREQLRRSARLHVGERRVEHASTISGRRPGSRGCSSRRLVLHVVELLLEERRGAPAARRAPRARAG